MNENFTILSRPILDYNAMYNVHLEKKKYLIDLNIIIII